MACGKCKPGDNNNWLLFDCKTPPLVASDSIIVIHKYNPNIVVEYMASSVNNCIQAPFVTECTLRMSYFDGFWQNYDHVKAITNRSEINNAMSFLTTIS